MRACKYSWFTLGHIELEVPEGQPGVCVRVRVPHLLEATFSWVPDICPRTWGSARAPPTRQDVLLEPNTALFLFGALVSDFSFRFLFRPHVFTCSVTVSPGPSPPTLTFLLCGYKLNLAPVNGFLLRS